VALLVRPSDLWCCSPSVAVVCVWGGSPIVRGGAAAGPGLGTQALPGPAAGTDDEAKVSGGDHGSGGSNGP
jgi:hypothetical protein